MPSGFFSDLAATMRGGPARVPRPATSPSLTLTRKTMIAGIGGALLATLIGVPAQAAPGATFSIPAPTGKYQVGTTDLHFIDQARQDPWKPERKRELMVTVWYPATDAASHPKQTWLSQGLSAAGDEPLSAAGVPKGSVNWSAAKTAGHVGAPRLAGDWPVILYSPGLAGQRAFGTVLVQELASQGYIVATIDHTYEAYTEFPGGRVEKPVDIPKNQAGLSKAANARLGDTRFVLDELGRRGWNTSKVGMFGHSFGGFTTAQAMVSDRRIAAGINLDGHLFTEYGDVANRGLDRPFFLYGRQEVGSDKPVEHSPFTDYDKTWSLFWENQKGPKRSAVLPNSGHQSFTDMQVVLPQLTKPLNLKAGQWVRAIGTIDPAESIRIQSAAVLDFFRTSLR